jgi:Cu/Ag efflux protein CusF
MTHINGDLSMEWKSPMSMHSSVKALITGAALTALAVMTPVFAQASPRHIRGTIESVQSHTLAVKTTRGATDDIALAGDAAVLMVSRADMSAIKDGDYVAITSVERDGAAVAVDVRVFDDSLRSRGEDHYPWDLGSTPNMTKNANIARVQEVGADRVLKLDYKRGVQYITVAQDAAVVGFTASTPDQIKPGAKVFVIAHTEAGGKIVAGAIVVGKEGLKPPM